jgi:hypothetical protein
VRPEALLLPVAVLVATTRAEAQISVQTSARTVEVGQPFQLQITAMSSSGDAPSNPELPVPPGFRVSGPSIGSQTQVTMSGGSIVQKTGISATWTISGSRAGKFTLGPASVEVGGRRVKSEPIAVEVVPEGTLPAPPRSRSPFDPFSFFDPFGRGSPFSRNPLFDDVVEPDVPVVPEEFRVETAPDPIAFFRMVVSPKRAVVGEQVTMHVYAYGGRGSFETKDVKLPSQADFLTYPLDDPSDSVQVPIGNTRFIAGKVYALALFPLRAGKLKIGELAGTFEGPRYRSREPIRRTTGEQEIEVVEPPLDGRPPGYRIGDVGKFELTATVEPKQVNAGDAVSVVARLEGSGNLPYTLNVPARRGVEWAAPAVTEKIEPDGTRIGGFRSFSYVVRLMEPGEVDLGEIALPYYDAAQKRYATARAVLGKVRVTGSVPNASKDQAAASDPLAAFLAPRATLADFPVSKPAFTHRSGFWYALFGTPLAVLLVAGGLSAASAARRRFDAQRHSPERAARDAINQAADAARSGRQAEATTHLERALFLAIEARTGLRARAVLTSALAATLVERGVSSALSEGVVRVLEQCETARFTGAGASVEIDRLVADGRALVAELGGKRKS